MSSGTGTGVGVGGSGAIGGAAAGTGGGTGAAGSGGGIIPPGGGNSAVGISTTSGGPSMSISNRSNTITGQQATYTRQATILRKNLIEWDCVLRTPARGEDWPTMLGRLNAAHNQTTNMNNAIEDVLEHFVYLPRKCTANAQDIPFFLSTRLEIPSDQIIQQPTKTKETDDDKYDEDDDNESAEQPPKKKQKKNKKKSSNKISSKISDPVHELAQYESTAAQLAAEYGSEDNMVRF